MPSYCPHFSWVYYPPSLCLCIALSFAYALLPSLCSFWVGGHGKTKLKNYSVTWPPLFLDKDLLLFLIFLTCSKCSLESEFRCAYLSRASTSSRFQTSQHCSYKGVPLLIRFLYSTSYPMSFPTSISVEGERRMGVVGRMKLDSPGWKLTRTALFPTYVHSIKIPLRLRLIIIIIIITEHLMCSRHCSKSFPRARTWALLSPLFRMRTARPTEICPKSWSQLVSKRDWLGLWLVARLWNQMAKLWACCHYEPDPLSLPSTPSLSITSLDNSEPLFHHLLNKGIRLDELQHPCGSEIRRHPSPDLHLKGSHDNSYEGTSRPGHQHQIRVLWWKQLPVTSFPTRNIQMPWEEFWKLLYWNWLILVATGHPSAPLSLLGQWIWLGASEGTQKLKWLSSKARFPGPRTRTESGSQSLSSYFWLVVPLSNL